MYDQILRFLRTFQKCKQLSSSPEHWPGKLSLPWLSCYWVSIALLANTTLTEEYSVLKTHFVEFTT